MRLLIVGLLLFISLLDFHTIVFASTDIGAVEVAEEVAIEEGSHNVDTEAQLQQDKQPLEDDAEEEGGVVAVTEKTASQPAKAVKISNRDCRWSWKNNRCEPADSCQYKYQFLDATIGESCRSRTAVTDKHVIEGGRQLSPLAVTAASTALVASDLAILLSTSVMKHHPMLFNAIQGAVLFAAGDSYFQVIEQGWRQEKIGYQGWRAFRSGLIGCLNNGILHYQYYKWIDREFPYHRFSEKRWGPPTGMKYRLGVAQAKYWIEWPTVGVYKIASMYLFVGLMSGSTWEDIKEKFRQKFMLTWLRSLQVWPIYDTILYAYVPASHRPFFNSIMSLFWSGYLSHTSQPEPDDEE